MSEQLANIYQQGFEAHRAGKLSIARQCYEQVLEVERRHFNALHMLGVVLYSQGKYKEAIEQYRHALSVRKDIAELHFNLGNALVKSGAEEEGIEAYRTALEQKPDFVNAHFALGTKLAERKTYAEAEYHLKRTTELNPKHERAFYNLAMNYLEQEQFDKAEEYYLGTLNINKNHVNALHGLGYIYFDSSDYKKARSYFEKALSLMPDSASAHNSLASTFMPVNNNLKHQSLAVTHYQKAIEINPNYANAHANLGKFLLLTGKYHDGWAESEWRIKMPGWRANKRSYSQAMWDGKESLHDKTLFVYSEQGFGDTIQFSRYLKCVKELGGKVNFAVQRPLKTLLSECIDVDELIGRGDKVPVFDLHCPLMSLPQRFNTKIDDMPVAANYIQAAELKVQYWQEKLSQFKRPYIGIAWSGSSTHKRDHERSIMLETFLKAVNRSASYFVLQKEIREKDKAILEEAKNVHDYADEFNDFSDTAGLIANLDLVITVDTSVAHLAGAMGKPVWILLHYCPDWRWLLDRDDSPWYPSARLFRQKSPGKWSGALSGIKQALKKFNY